MLVLAGRGSSSLVQSVPPEFAMQQKDDPHSAVLHFLFLSPQSIEQQCVAMRKRVYESPRWKQVCLYGSRDLYLCVSEALRFGRPTPSKSEMALT